jgi:hypothetical protein
MIIAPGQVSSEVLMTSLGEACAAGDIRSMTHLLDNGASVNDFIVSGCMRLRFALSMGGVMELALAAAVFRSFSTTVTDCLVSFGNACTVACNWKLAQMVL